MQHDPHRSLFVQCHRRASAYFAKTGCKPIPSHIEISAIWLMKQAIRNHNRIPEDVPFNPATGFPDSYLDDILYYAAVEGPYVAALSNRDGEAWDMMASLIASRVHTYLRRYSSPLDRDILEEDVVQICCVDFWQWLEVYPYDCRLDAWISQCISRRVLRIFTSPSYKHTYRHLSIDDTLNRDDRVLGDILPDDGAMGQFSQAEMMMVLNFALKRLPPQQREVILSVLSGEDVAECSVRLGCSPNSIYKLRERARKTLRRYMDI